VCETPSLSKERLSVGAGVDDMSFNSGRMSGCRWVGYGICNIPSFDGGWVKLGIVKVPLFTGVYVAWFFQPRRRETRGKNGDYDGNRLSCRGILPKACLFATVDVVAAAVTTFDVFCRIQKPDDLCGVVSSVDPASCGHDLVGGGFPGTCYDASAIERREIEPEKNHKEKSADRESDGQSSACLGSRHVDLVLANVDDVSFFRVH